jgi:hypothetical protein
MLKDDPDRRPQTIGGIVYLAVLASAGVGLGLAFAGAWRTGVAWVGIGLLVGAVSRLLLPDRSAGMLGVRSKLVDVALLALGGVALVVLAVVGPRGPGG